MPLKMDDSIQTWGRHVVQALDQTLGGDRAVDVIALQRAVERICDTRGYPDRHALIAVEKHMQYQRVPIVVPPERDYSAIVILWPPGYTTDIHDHNGHWGLLTVLLGGLSVENYSFPPGNPEAIAFTGTTDLDAGQSTGFSVAHYAHRCRNPSDTVHAMSLHVYGGALDRYRAFIPEADNAWRVELRHPVLARAEHF